MLDGSLTRQEKNLVMWLRWCVGMFSLAAIGFIFFPSRIIAELNVIGHVFFGSDAAILEPSNEKFWLVLGLAMMAVIIVAAIKAQLNIIKNSDYVKLIILAKLASTIGFFVSFIIHDRSFAYLAGALIDGIILFITWWLFRRATVSRYIR